MAVSLRDRQRVADLVKSEFAARYNAATREPSNLDIEKAEESLTKSLKISAMIAQLDAAEKKAASLPPAMQRQMVEKNISFYVIDAYWYRKEGVQRVEGAGVHAPTPVAVDAAACRAQSAWRSRSSTSSRSRARLAAMA